MTDTRIDEKALERAKEEAFNKVMGRNDMPSDVLPEYDRWLFNASIAEYLAARAEAGFVEVPREPAGHQVVAIRNFVTGWADDPVGHHKARGVYRAMIAKAR